ncbi:MAG: hypothetical protein HY744_34125 [Deltaproteobacteria bacterium]|nr:hypothetical protein [Deltaproteobacteria bacterium]
MATGLARETGHALALVLCGVLALACGSGGAAAGTGGGGASVAACAPEGVVEYCYPGDPSTEGVGECENGTRTCAQGGWSECAGYRLPEDESCDDGLDDNCNGVADEGCSCEEGSTRSCYTGPAASRGIGMCQDGVQSCAGGTWSASCEGGVTPAAESCDKQDNDCNGVVDDGCPCADGETQACYSGPSASAGIGACHGGQQICTGGQWPAACAGEVVPGPENCNGADDDCDGAADEDDPGGGVGCDTGKPGVCAAGTRHCQGATLVCVPGQSPSDEKCDGQDNNCNGETDEGDPGGGGGCETGKAGVCGAGTYHCQGGALQCAQNQGPSDEKCDGQDNNCNGQADEGDPGGGGGCNTGKAGVCAAGTYHCQGGSVQCVQNDGPSDEKCDGQDNNCNGKVDEGDPGGGGKCETGKAGACAAGIYHCQDGKVQCVQNEGPSDEKCDGQDNNCDGKIDEGNPGGGGDCDTGLKGECASGTYECEGGSVQCIQDWPPEAEQCDGLDNDCDGQTDEGPPKLCEPGEICVDGYCEPW